MDGVRHDAQHAGRVGGAQETHRAVDVDVEWRSGVIDQRHALVEAHVPGRLVGDVPGFPVERRRGLPMREVEGIARLEIERGLAALRSQPEAVLAAEHVHVRLICPGGDGFAPEPPEARRLVAPRGAGQNTALIGRADRHLGATLAGQQHEAGVLFQKGNVVGERACGHDAHWCCWFGRDGRAPGWPLADGCRRTGRGTQSRRPPPIAERDAGHRMARDCIQRGREQARLASPADWHRAFSLLPKRLSRASTLLRELE